MTDLYLETRLFLKYNHLVNIPALNKVNFKNTIFIKIDELWANQRLITTEVLNQKLRNKNLSTCFVVKYMDKKILIDGHHTVISKKINGRNRVKVKYLDLDEQFKTSE